MTTLADFTLPPNDRSITCERNSRLLSNPSSTVSDYKKIDLTSVGNQRKNLVTPQALDKAIFLNTDETVADKVLTAWERNGISGVIEVISNDSGTPMMISSIAKRMDNYITAIMKWRAKVLHEENIKAKEERNLLLTCHPHTSKIAVVLPNTNEVKIIKSSNINSADQELILKDKRIRKINCIAWRPMSSMSIAVASNNCIIVWLIDGNTATARPGSNTTRHLQSNELKTDITSLSWCKDGVLLAASCKYSASFLIWNIITQSSTVIQRAGSPTSFLNWSNCGQRLITSTETDIFRVWETSNWSCEKWADLNGKCTNACWSSDGTVLLFTVENEPFIYAINFYPNKGSNYNTDSGNSGVAVKCADLTALNEENDGFGGFVSGMAWDPTNSRLAVTFYDTNGTSNQRGIALFHTKILPIIQFIPCGVVQGEIDEIPLTIDFNRSFVKGAQLVVGWSNSTISFIPCYFNKDLLTTANATSLSFRDLLHDTIDETRNDTWMG